MQNRNVWTCRHCDTENITADIFCSHCGFSMDSSILTDQTASSAQGSPLLTATPSGSSSGRRVTGSLEAMHLLEGRYRIVQSIGRGGFGAVYKATNERFQSKPLVAIKEMSDAQLSSKEKENTIQDFRNEADLLVQLSHPNLPRVSDFFEEGDKAYLVMDFVQGQTLEDLQNDVAGPLDEHMVLGWALQLCQVLHYLHTHPQPIIFRDMKPSNVMITSAGEVKLIDFGIARVFKSSRTKDTTLLGSHGYAPLEQYGRGQSDARSDIYGLGATLFDLLTNIVPLDSPSRRIYPQNFVTPRQINPTISPVIEAIILKAMGEDLMDRYQTALEMYQAIISTGIGTTPLAAPVQPPYPSPTAAKIQLPYPSPMAAQIQLPYPSLAADKVQPLYTNPMAYIDPMATKIQSVYANPVVAKVPLPYANATAAKFRPSYANTAVAKVQAKSWMTTFVLFYFFGWCGGHRFYTGRWITGLLQLFTLGGYGIWLLVDLILLIIGKFTDSKGQSLYRPPILGGRKRWVTTFLLFVFLGLCGGHRFYTGHWVTGILQLFTFGGCGIWLLVDLIQLLRGRFTDSKGMLLTRAN